MDIKILWFINDIIIVEGKRLISTPSLIFVNIFSNIDNMRK